MPLLEVNPRSVCRGNEIRFYIKQQCLYKVILVKIFKLCEKNNFYKTPLFLTNLQPVSHLTIPIPKRTDYNFCFSHKILKFLRKFVNVFRFSLFRKFRNKFEKFTSFNNFEDFPFTLTGERERWDEAKMMKRRIFSNIPIIVFQCFEDRNPQRAQNKIKHVKFLCQSHSL